MSVILAGLVSRVGRSGNIEYLFIEYKKFPELNGLCGGHAENGESETETLQREFKEELGVKVKPTRKLHTMPSDINGDTINIWDCQIDSDIFVIQKNEIVDVKWFSRSAIISSPKIFFPAIHKFFKNTHTLL